MPAMKPHRCRWFLTLALVVLSAGASAANLTPEVLARVAEANQDSVLFYGGALKFLCGRCSKVHESHLLGTAVVVDAAGLFLANLDGAVADPKTEIQESTLKIVLPDATEVPVRIAVTDRDLGVVVLALDTPTDAGNVKFKPVSIEAVPEAKPLDELILLRRLDKRTGYALAVATMPVNAVDRKPRVTYLSTALAGRPPMTPCFDAQGRLVALSTGHETALAAEEFTELVRQGRNAKRP